jgi:hypothetical protein
MNFAYESCMFNLFKKQLTTLVFISLAVPHASFAALRCGEVFRTLSLKNSIATFENSEIGKFWLNHRLVESLRLIQNLGLRVPGNYQYRVYVSFKPKDTNGKPIDRAALLYGFNDLPIQNKDDGSAIWISVPFNRLPAFLDAVSRPDFVSSVDYFAARDVQGDAKAAHVDAKMSENRRGIEIQNSYIDRFISNRSAYTPELVSDASRANNSDNRTYLFKREKFLTVPKNIEVSHGFGKKYDRFIQLGAAALLADIFRLNFGDVNVATQDRLVIHPEFLFNRIANVGINVLGIRKSSSSDMPYSMTVEIDVAGTTNPDRYGRPSRQRISAEIQFDGTSISTPRVGITKINFVK